MAAQRLLVRSAARAQTTVFTPCLPRPARAIRTTTTLVASSVFRRQLSTSTRFSMPDQLKSSEVSSKTDPSVAKQYDDQTDKAKQIQDFFSLADDKKIGILSTYRNGVGPVGRSMATARRDGPDFLFLANAHARKFADLAANKQVQITFQDSKTQDWISVSGTATTTDNSDPRIKDVWSRGAAAWFGDLGDGVHDGSADDPRMALIEVKSNYVTYYKTDVGLLGYAKEVAGAAMTGRVANTGVLRELSEQDLDKARSIK
ncbi:protein bli-3 [Stagonosporopsis vannaccii]|nr:protein bli-3 [Stagonosporopsis vannaccii]